MAKTGKIKDIAQALIEAAVEKEAVSDVMRDLHEVTLALKANRRFMHEFADASVPFIERRHALEETFKDVHPLVFNALCLLQDAGQLKKFKEFSAAAASIAQTLVGHFEIFVTSAVPLTAENRKALERVLEKKFSGTRHVHEEIDPSILGGLVITIGEWIFDASLRQKLNELHAKLK